MTEHAYEFGQDHAVETTNQVARAGDALYRPDTDWVEWPWPDLTTLAGRMKPRDIWFICGFSGNGKTLFVSSAVQEWIAQQVKVYVLPLETAADDFRLYLACQSAGIDPGIVNRGGMLDMPTDLRRHWEKKIKAELDRQALDHAVHDYLRVKGVPSINLARLKLAAAEARDWGAKILVVDHIDRIKGGNGTNLHAESVAVNDGAKDLAMEYNLIFLFTSQMNNESVKGSRDRLAQFGPPMPHHVFMGGHKRHIATGMLSLHRRLRDPLPLETTEEYHAAVKRARDGDGKAMDVLAPNVMAVSAMKLRNDGGQETGRAFLGVQHGRLHHLPEKDQQSTTYDALRRA